MQVSRAPVAPGSQDMHLLPPPSLCDPLLGGVWGLGAQEVAGGCRTPTDPEALTSRVSGMWTKCACGQTFG